MQKQNQTEGYICKNKIKQKERPAPANSDVFVFEKKTFTRMMVLKEIEI